MSTPMCARYPFPPPFSLRNTHGASLLDRLLKEIVTEARTIDLDKFIPLLKQYLSMNNPCIRRLVVSWISVSVRIPHHSQVLDNKPGVDMLEYFPQLIDGLFLLLGDEHREIRIVIPLLSSPLGSGRRADLLPLGDQEQRDEPDGDELAGEHASLAPAPQRPLHPPHRRHVALRVHSPRRRVGAALRPHAARAHPLLCRQRARHPRTRRGLLQGAAGQRCPFLPLSRSCSTTRRAWSCRRWRRWPVWRWRSDRRRPRCCVCSWWRCCCSRAGQRWSPTNGCARRCWRRCTRRTTRWSRARCACW